MTFLLKRKGINKADMPPLIEKNLNIQKVLKKSSKKWDGGYVIGGMIGHGDSFVMRDPHGIRPAYYFEDEEVVVVASERPAIQTVFDISYKEINEIPRGNALIIKKDGKTSIKEIQTIREIAPKAKCHYMHTVKSRESIKDAYFKYGVKSFSLDTKDELIKIIDSTNKAKDLELFVRISVSNEHAEIDLSKKFGAANHEATGSVSYTHLTLPTSDLV